MENVFISKHTLIRYNRDRSKQVPFTLEAYDVNSGNKKEIVYNDLQVKDYLFRMKSLSQNRRYAYCTGTIPAIVVPKKEDGEEEGKDQITAEE